MQQTGQPYLDINRKKPIMTWLIILATCGVFVLQWQQGALEDVMGLIRMGAKENLLIYMGQYWRLVTPLFLHSGLEHLAGNMIALFIWGPHVETLFGRIRFLIIYFLSGIAGTCLSYLISPNPSVGASGAIFGLIGAFFSFRRSYPEVFRKALMVEMVVVVLLNLVPGFFTSGIDNMGHIGGLVGGYLTAEFVGTYRDTVWTTRKYVAVVLYVVFIAACLLMGPRYLI